VIAELCFRFPHHLVYNDARAFYAAHMGAFRTLLLVCIVATFVLGCISVLMLRSAGHGAMGLVLGVVAILLGGPNAEALTSEPRPVSAGLDYFVLSLFVLGLLFVPMERIWPLRAQRIFRTGWQTDLGHFFANHVGVQLLAFLSMVPVQLFFSWLADHRLQRAVAAQPMWLQFAEIFITVEMASYWTHRAFHRVPFLWRFHSIHHSVEQMDWLAGSRLHVVDVIVTRLAGFLPVFVLGFSPAPVYGYLIFVSFHAVYIHANVNHRWPLVRRILTTPEFHHWHHAAEPEAVDKNFAVLLSCIDSLFGTAYRPDRWPAAYGVIGMPPPRGYWRQLLFPFRLK
jgi:sterol desaturase/sphingolipid hydroxylase (fatty acid hydroxylase superfamily)